MSELRTTYRTLDELSMGIYKEKGSKFIGLAIACYTEAEAKVYLEKWRKEHYQSRHLCYAYRFGVDKQLYRANDDGEPNNSAGAPILGQIQSFDLSNVLIGVVRYYGGTKLGVGGLI
ncbi:MAG: IMPACT family protein, partial [Flavobacteriales bacterium]